MRRRIPLSNGRYHNKHLPWFGHKQPWIQVVANILGAVILYGHAMAAEPFLPADRTLADLLEMSPAELSKIDLAEMYLVCASGLPGVRVDVEGCREALDRWAAEIRQQPLDGDQFKKSQELLFILKRDQSRFKIPLPLSMAYVSLGRRLAFPLKLASASGIPCVRWEDGNDSFNVPGVHEEVLYEATRSAIEHTGQRIEVTPRRDKPQQTGNTQVLGVRDELSVFVGMKAVSLEQAGMNAEALVAFSQAHCLCPCCTDHLNGLLRVAKKIMPWVDQAEPMSATEARESATDEVLRLNRLSNLKNELFDLQQQVAKLRDQQQMDRRKFEQ